MYCTLCHRELGECLCPDIDERLASLGKPGGPIVYRKCAVCNKHYARCKCAEPIWTTSQSIEGAVDLLGNKPEIAL